jgi:hypothetical protein
MEMELTEWQYECEIVLPVSCTLIPVVNRTIGKDAKITESLLPHIAHIIVHISNTEIY